MYCHGQRWWIITGENGRADTWQEYVEALYWVNNLLENVFEKETDIEKER